jgi:hypothetical protein
VQGNQIEDPEVVACTIAIVKGIKFSKSATGKKTRGYHAFEFGKRAKH